VHVRFARCAHCWDRRHEVCSHSSKPVYIPSCSARGENAMALLHDPGQALRGHREAATTPAHRAWCSRKM
jgi:hypothetical protein